MPLSKHRRRRGRAASPVGRVPSNQSVANPRRKKKPNYLYLAASAVIAVLVIGGFALGSANFGQSSLGRTGSSTQYVEGVGEQQSIMPSAAHIAGAQTASYNTTPPTSGEMWA